MRRAVVSLLIALVLGAARCCAGAAFHCITPALVQIPPIGDESRYDPAPALGRPPHVLFDSDADLAGNNGSTGRQIYLFDLQLRDVQGISPSPSSRRAPLDDQPARAGTGRRAVKIAYDAHRRRRTAAAHVVDRRTGVRTPAHRRRIRQQATPSSTTASASSSSSPPPTSSTTGVGGTQICRIDLRQASSSAARSRARRAGTPA